MRHFIFAAVASYQVNLVFHQCNQWGYNNCHTFTDHAGNW